MPEATPMAIRQGIVQRYKQGEKISSLATCYKISRATIHRLIKREDQEGQKGLMTKYVNCGKKGPDENDFIYRSVRCMKNWHPGWGAEKIRAEILRIRPALIVPHYRTLNRWFHKNNQIAIKIKSKLPEQKSRQAKFLHEVWQIDAKEQIPVANGTMVCWLNITDEFSGTVVDPVVFPL